uniref:Uncharacterized protein n=1 Tax=Physcomitrium patens TaxID=3218 RepID=A0A2K1L3K7_PHYPA|nr:hypothetical protein PHYPA_003399 [Physcomitrium patens]
MKCNAFKTSTMKKKILHLVNNNDMLVVSHFSVNTTNTISLHTMLDFKAQLFMIDKWFAQELRLTSLNLEPSTFTIVTLVGA